MTERHRYREVLYCTSAVVLLTYAVIMVAGYWFFAQYTLSPGKVQGLFCSSKAQRICFCAIFFPMLKHRSRAHHCFT
jgi:hypothetical protein